MNSDFGKINEGYSMQGIATVRRIYEQAETAYENSRTVPC
jgi:hypothetical protein